MPAPLYVLHNRWLPDIYLNFNAPVRAVVMGSTPSRHCHCVHVCSCTMPYAGANSPYVNVALQRALMSESKSVQHTAIRDVTLGVTDGSTIAMCSQKFIDRFKEWGATEELRKVVIAVLSERLKLGWPYNYKAVDVLAVMPDAALIPFIDRLDKLTKLDTNVRGSADLKKLVKPVLDRANKAKEAKAEEEARKKQAAIEAAAGNYYFMYNQGLNAASPYNRGYYDGLAAQADRCCCGVCLNCMPSPPGHTWPYSTHPGSPLGFVRDWPSNTPDDWAMCVRPHRVSYVCFPTLADED